MSVLRHHPHLHFQLNQELIILIMTMLLLLMALWILAQTRSQPLERAVPQPVIASEKSSAPPLPKPFHWLKIVLMEPT